MNCRRRRLQPIVHPPMCCTHHTTEIIEVPHIHPIQHTTVNHQMFQHKHYFPQSHNAVQSVSNQQFNCNRPF
ncbi:spore coat protein [Jeotgalibacillus sp. S-D1]|uniref:CotD family spore coat protein n=1 Tax=Jeotgalibacillus sp. S-D1 TaxID=2552189 RepID=UPI001059DF64|nr:CotD family spore coat protein [Jeotgalibacillus sp. S-D1]TDL34772.1 spore coat protein [Jeotgalibacillus sp. S-D1]